MSDLHAVTDTEATNGHKPEDAFERVQRARTKPSRTTDDTGQVLRKLAAANKLAGLTKGKRICRAVKRGDGDGAEYDLDFENGARVTCTRPRLAEPRHMDLVLAEATKTEPPYLTPKEWRPFALAVVLAAESDNSTTSEDEETLEWLALFLEHSDKQLVKVLSRQTRHEDALRQRGREVNEQGASLIELPASQALHTVMTYDTGAWIGSDRRLYVRVPALRTFMVDHKLPRVTSTQLGQRLGRLHFTKPNNTEGKLTAWNADRTVSVSRRYLASQPGFELS
jgi:hypothetical protein